MSDPSPDGAPFFAGQYTKQEVRRRVLALRDSLPSDVHAVYSRRIAQGIAALPSFAAAHTVLLFYPFGSEWMSALLVQEALQCGKTVALPRVLLSQGARQMALQAIEDIARDTVPGFRGILEPLPERPLVSPETIDWVLTPGVAFTRSGDRLGYGGGFYDRLLAHMPSHVPRVAGAFGVQIIDTLPTDAHDCPVDVVYTERHVFHRARR
ncbi:MAG: 5-formyltetrahydrofolate cyclo-ligase [Proteobacteria bacterium]|nr:5-formyltetrahydrofolate cyclo-ligase [Pseudomonadota bacterium]